MKNQYIIVAAIATVVLLSSCRNNKEIDTRLVTKLYNEKAADLCKNKVYVEIDTGYYELNDIEKRTTLQKLAHAGVIEYTTERYAWYTKCVDRQNTTTKVIDYYCEDTDELVGSENIMGIDTVANYSYEEHYMVWVRIARKYRSMILDKEPVPIADRDMALPEYHYTAEDLLEDTEEWEELVEPRNPNPRHERQYIACAEPTAAHATEAIQVKADEINYPYCHPTDSAVANSYQRALMRSHRQTIKLLGYEVKAVKARKLTTFVDTDSIRKARCEVIVKSTHVTPQGHILLDQIIDGIPASADVAFFYYDDTGWEIETDSFSVPQIIFSKESLIPSTQHNSQNEPADADANSAQESGDKSQKATIQYTRKTDHDIVPKQTTDKNAKPAAQQKDTIAPEPEPEPETKPEPEPRKRDYGTSQKQYYFTGKSAVMHYLNGRSFYNGDTLVIRHNGVFINGQCIGGYPSVEQCAAMEAIITVKSGNKTLTFAVYPSEEKVIDNNGTTYYAQ